MFPLLTKRSLEGSIRLIDEYSLFYLTWIAENSKIGLESVDSEFWIKKQSISKWNTWSGCAFESLCLKHIQKIKKALGISGISTIESGWHYLPKKAINEQGAQIDLVIDRADKCINLCEMKYSSLEFTIDKPYEEKLQNKKSVFRKQTETTKTLFVTMVTTYGIKKNAY